LRLLDPTPTPGLTYTIDSLDILTVNRTHLRSAIIAVPQECVFLPDGSSIRSNIDPTNTISATECAEILDTVRLTPFVAAAGGLDAPMSGDQLSAGQQQLFSLGRAVYRRRARMRVAGRDGVIKNEFGAYTVVAVAHRLRLMVDFVDRVVVLDQGRVVEEGRGSELLEKEEGWFRRLYLAGQ
jgi:ATP-binding cassette subfamily C (CFTR/MRP) protein 1